MERWEIDSSRSAIRFAVRHLAFSKVRGEFGRWSATMLVPDDDFGRASLNVEIDASSINTGIVARDQHLLRADFFDTRRYPDVTFTSSRVRLEAAGRLTIVGALTMKGMTHNIGLSVEPRGRKLDSWGNERAVFTARATIDRQAFGIRGSRMAQLVVGRHVEVDIEVEAVKQAAPSALPVLAATPRAAM